MKFPIMGKSKICSGAFSKYGHEFIIIKTEEALKKLCQESLYDISKIKGVIFQEIIDPSS